MTKSRGRAQYETVYSEAAKWIVRGILIDSPHSIREKYKDSIQPLELGGDGMNDHLIGEAISKEEVENIENFIQDILSIPVPDPSNVTLKSAAQYRADVVSFSESQFKKFDVLRENLETITLNVSTRDLLLSEEDTKSLTSSDDLFDDKLHHIEPAQYTLSHEEMNETSKAAQAFRQEIKQWDKNSAETTLEDDFTGDFADDEEMDDFFKEKEEIQPSSTASLSKSSIFNLKDSKSDNESDDEPASSPKNKI